MGTLILNNISKKEEEWNLQSDDDDAHAILEDANVPRLWLLTYKYIMYQRPCILGF